MLKRVKQCSQCGYDKSKVVDCRLHDDGVVRRRMCPKCGFRWSTIELEYMNAEKIIRLYGLNQNPKDTTTP
jgi:transcriptional regulator NrdR family protein